MDDFTRLRLGSNTGVISTAELTATALRWERVPAALGLTGRRGA